MTTETALLLTAGILDESNAKTAHGLIRGPSRFRLLGVVDDRHAGRDAGEVLDGRERGLPCFANLYIETFCDMLPVRPRAAFNLIVELTWAAFAVSLMVLGWMVARVASLQESPGLEVPMSWPYSGMVLGGAYLLIVALRRIGGGAWRPAA